MNEEAMVRRYQCIGGSMYIDETMHPNGVIRFVLATDYDALLAQNAALVEENAKLKKLLRNVDHCGDDPRGRCKCGIDAALKEPKP